MADLKRGLSVEDQELVKRLSKLKSEIREMKSVPSEMEIEERLAKLKGVDPQVYRKPVVLVKPNTGGVDEVTHLLNQVRDEVSIDTQMDLDPSSTPVQQSDQVHLFICEVLLFLFTQFEFDITESSRCGVIVAERSSCHPS